MDGAARERGAHELRMKTHLGKAGLIWIGLVAEADDAITLCGYACLGQLQGRLRNDQILAAAHLSTTAIHNMTNKPETTASLIN